MKSEYKKLSKTLEINTQFEVPIYQRTYDWHKKHCKRLYDDIVKAGKPEGRPHFIGATTYVGELDVPGSNVSHYQIIDGQQRFTTLLLLLRALRESLNDTCTLTEKRIDQLLFNNNEEKDGNEYYKLVLTDDDNVILEDIMKNGHSEKSSNITANFNFFLSKLRDGNINPDIIWSGIQRLSMVQILIDKDENPQEIFESMNSTGLNLSATDMIQNYLLMSEDQGCQKRIYKDYWRPMEIQFESDELSGQDDYFEDFIRNYLAMHKGKIVTKKEMYEDFKTYMNGHDKEKEIEKMYKYSKHYYNLLCPDKHPSDKIKTVIEYIHSQDTKVANPLLLKLLIDYADGIITENECVDALTLVDSYILRCYVCNTTKGGNKVFPELIPKINNNNYVKDIEKELMSKSGNRRFPRDGTFKRNLEGLQLYLNIGICMYILVRLEHDNHSEKIKSDSLTIEHIMPKTLTDDWKDDLGDNWKSVHEEYLDKIGNLTLMAQDNNSIASNDSFSNKRAIYKDSTVYLTRSLGKLQYWREDEIKKRTDSLVEQAVKLWRCPEGYDFDGQSVDTDYDEEYEEDYLEKTEIVDLWNKLKEEIQSSCVKTQFKMTKLYGSFRIFTESKSGGLCTLEARKNKIKLNYNTKIQDGLISPSEFVKDVSGKGKHGVGDMASVIMTEDDIDRAVKLIKIVYEHKIKL